ncbi:MAG TPA: hypothetical protein VKB34_04105 [Povalibacter sp.]|nr:hypothetical protein [Povalibacter sp.]
MKWTATIAVLAVAAAAAAWYWWPTTEAQSQVTVTRPAIVDQPAVQLAQADVPTAADAAVAFDDPVREQEARLAFHARARQFFAAAAALTAAERVRQAKSIAADVDRYEHSGELSAGEALLLKSALIRASVADPAGQQKQVDQFERSYRADTNRRLEAWSTHRDPMFELYKLRESVIISNVMSMSTIPEGLSRDEYLRRRLQSERELLLESGN